jgi:hypothetical protein
MDDLLFQFVARLFGAWDTTVAYNGAFAAVLA